MPQVELNQLVEKPIARYFLSLDDNKNKNLINYFFLTKIN